ncbi:FAD-binding oxidoreductase [Nonomuraea angiospora]|uniref:FAD-binding oxidoreductase n=1 Tax=Nonomuraea angiospora TaxID=46172 RepID=UPI00331AED23
MTHDITDLRATVQGEVLTPRDAGYEDARALHNSMISRRPAAIVRVSGTADVVRTLSYAREHALEVSVRGGGHGVAGHALGGDLVIDLSALRGVTVDAAARTAVVQAGAIWGEVDQATQAHGLAVPGGRISHTGVAGLTLGGGEGWLSAKYGLSCDNLIAVELVTADGRVVVADDESEPELMWALRGGGGNFGVVTSFTFRLHPLGPLVLGGMLGYRVSDAPAVLEALDRLHSAGHDDFAPAAVFLTAPPAPFVPGHVVGRPILAIAPVWLGDPEAGAEVIRPLFEAATPLFDAVQPMPYLALQSMLDDGSQPGRRNRWSAEFVPGLDPSLISDLQDAAIAAPSPLSQLIVSPLPEAVRTAPDSAFPSRHGGRWLVHPVGVWVDPGDDPANLAWVEEVTSAIRKHGVTGSYLNLEQADDDRVRWAMGVRRYRRLQQVKAAWDPGDVFRHCAHVSP